MRKNTVSINLVPARDILTEIENGKDVKYDNVIIKGDIDISKLILKRIYAKRSEYEIAILNLSDTIKRVDSQITISNSIIDGKVIANNICLGKIINFFGSQFKRDVDFSKSQFKKGAYFSGSSFGGDTNFSESEFCKAAYFSKCRFSDVAYFNGSLFQKNAYFSASEFCKGSDFGRTKFIENAYFGGTHLCEVADFSGSHFLKGGEFRGSKFGGDANFRRSQFDQDTYFNESKFINPGKSTIEKKVDFGEAKFIGDLLFDDVIFDQIFLLNINKIRFNKFYIKWNFIKDCLLPSDEAYLSLVENYKKLGWMEDADECYYGYRVNHQKRIQQELEKSMKKLMQKDKIWEILTLNFLRGSFSAIIKLFFDETARYSYGYGLKPERPLLLSALIILISGIAFFYSINSPLSCANQATSFGEVLLYSANIFSSGATSLINATSTSIPTMKGNLVYLVTIERLFGWVFFVLFLASIGKTIIR